MLLDITKFPDMLALIIPLAVLVLVYIAIVIGYYTVRHKDIYKNNLGVRDRERSNISILDNFVIFGVAILVGIVCAFIFVPHWSIAMAIMFGVIAVYMQFILSIRRDDRGYIYLHMHAFTWILPAFLFVGCGAFIIVACSAMWYWLYGVLIASGLLVLVELVPLMIASFDKKIGLHELSVTNIVGLIFTIINGVVTLICVLTTIRHFDGTLMVLWISLGLVAVFASDFIARNAIYKYGYNRKNIDNK